MSKKFVQIKENQFIQLHGVLRGGGGEGGELYSPPRVIFEELLFEYILTEVHFEHSCIKEVFATLYTSYFYSTLFSKLDESNSKVD
jgi:hypothetical protein